MLLIGSRPEDLHVERSPLRGLFLGLRTGEKFKWEYVWQSMSMKEYFKTQFILYPITQVEIVSPSLEQSYKDNLTISDP